MDLSLNAKEEALKKEARRFMEKEAPKEILLELEKTETGITPELWNKVVQTGWLGTLIPESYGGKGGTLTSAGVLLEELGRGPLPGPFFSSGILGSLVLLQAGSEEQKKKVLPAIARGEDIFCLALAEEEYGWTPESIRTTAAAAQGDFILEGTKLFVRDAGAATHIICAARSGEGAEEGISLFVVAKRTKGVAVRPLPGFMGWVYEVNFEKVKIPGSALLGRKGTAWPPLKAAVEKAVPLLCAYQVGGCQAVFEMSVARSQTREQFGTPIGRFQRIQDHIIEIVNQLDAARWTTYEALWKLDTGKPAGESVHMAKAVTSEAYFQACTLAHHVHGGIGYSESFGLTLHTKMSRALYHQLGDPRHHRRQLAGLLGW